MNSKITQAKKSDALIVAQEKKLHRFLSSKLANEADAKDFAQEAFLRLLRVENTKLINNPEAYLVRIAKNLVYEHYVNLPAQPSSSEDMELECEDESIEEQANRSQSMQTLERALTQLSPKCRAVIVLHRRDGMTYEEIAQTLGISASMVKKYLIQGLSKCRTLLRQHHEW